MRRLLFALALIVVPTVASAAPQALTIFCGADFDGSWYVASSTPPIASPHGTLGGAPRIFPTTKRVSDALVRLGCTGARFDCKGTAFWAYFAAEGAYVGLSALNAKSCVPSPPTCSDGIKNQDESDADCGGTKCSPCGDNRFCSVATDCTSGHCAAGISGACAVDERPRCRPAQCFNGAIDPGESDVDCGVNVCTFQPCAAGQACTHPCSCAVGLTCSGGVCG